MFCSLLLLFGTCYRFAVVMTLFTWDLTPAEYTLCVAPILPLHCLLSACLLQLQPLLVSQHVLHICMYQHRGKLWNIDANSWEGNEARLWKMWTRFVLQLCGLNNDIFAQHAVAVMTRLWRRLGEGRNGHWVHVKYIFILHTEAHCVCGKGAGVLLSVNGIN